MASDKIRSGRVKLMAGTACALLMAVISTVASAQPVVDQPANAGASAVRGGSSASSASLGDIVVTARNRTEKLQEVPLAITSFDAKTLERNQVRNLRDLAYLTPGLSISSGGSEFGVQPIIRGQVNLNGGSGDPNVAVFIDGVYISNNTAINVGLTDIERIEVVKGPVSALYGHNAFGGAINYVSKKPSTTDFGGRVQLLGGNDGQRNAMASVNVPVIKDVLGVRIAGGYEHFDGSYHDKVTGENAGGYKKRDFQGSFLFKPASILSVTGSYYYGNDRFGPSALAYNANNCGPKTSAAQDPNGSGYTAFCGHFDEQAHPVEVAKLPSDAGASGNQRKVNLASLNAGVDLGFAKLTSITGYAKVDEQRYTDFIGRRDGIPFLLTPGPGTVNLLELFGSNTNNRDFSQELRLQSQQDKPFRWSVGGFYYHDRTFSTTLVGIGGAPIPAGQSLLPGFPADSYSSSSVISNKRISQSLSHDKQLSGFVGAEYDVISGLTVSGEYRYTHQKKDQIIIRSTGCSSTLTVAAGSCTGPAPTPYLYPNGLTPASGTFNYGNYRGTVKYQVTQTTMAYASVASGTKAGGFNQRSVALPDGSQPDLKFNPEKNRTYEIGVKNSFLNNRLQLNIAAYHIDTRGIQISGPSSVPTNPALVTKNFGSVHTNGFEVELAAKVAEGVRVTSGVGYSDPKFGSDAYDFGAGTACLSEPACAGRVVVAAPGTTLNPVGAPINTTSKNVLSLNGLHLPRTSNLQLTGGLDLDGDLDWNNWKWNATASARYESKQYIFNNNISFISPRVVIDLKAGVANEHFNISVFVNNLTNDRTPELVSSNARLSDFNGDLSGYLPLGRMFGVTAGYTF